MLENEEVFVFPPKKSKVGFRTARGNVQPVMGFDEYFVRITRRDSNGTKDFGFDRIFEPYKMSADTGFNRFVKLTSFNPNNFKPFECELNAQERNN